MLLHNNSMKNLDFSVHIILEKYYLFLQQRVTMVAIQCFGPVVLRKALRRLEESARSGRLSTYLRPELRTFLMQHTPTLSHSLTVIHRLHLILFYFNGTFYHLAKRVTGVKYVSFLLFYVTVYTIDV